MGSLEKGGTQDVAAGGDNLVEADAVVEKRLDGGLVGPVEHRSGRTSGLGTSASANAGNVQSLGLEFQLQGLCQSSLSAIPSHRSGQVKGVLDQQLMSGRRAVRSRSHPCILPSNGRSAGG